jgi:hypothetical protein
MSDRCPLQPTKRPGLTPDGVGIAKTPVRPSRSSPTLPTRRRELSLRSRIFSSGARDNQGQNFAGWMKRYSVYFAAGELCSKLLGIEREFPRHMRRLEDIALPIQHEILGTE